MVIRIAIANAASLGPGIALGTGERAHRHTNGCIQGRFGVTSPSHSASFSRRILRKRGAPCHDTHRHREFVVRPAKRQHQQAQALREVGRRLPGASLTAPSACNPDRPPSGPTRRRDDTRYPRLGLGARLGNPRWGRRNKAPIFAHKHSVIRSSLILILLFLLLLLLFLSRACF